MLAGLGSAQCPSAACAPAHTQGSTVHTGCSLLSREFATCVWFVDLLPAAIGGVALLRVTDRMIAN